MKISEEGIDLICCFEAFREAPYPDPASGGEPITIGFGTTVYPDGRKVTLHDTSVDIDTARTFVEHHVAAKIEPYMTGLQLTQRQYDAICSFCYNEGAGAISTSNGIGRALRNAPDSELVRVELMKWVYANHVHSTGLVNRRRMEADYYFGVK